MNHHHNEKNSHVAIIGIIALVCIVGVILGSFYYYKHQEYRHAEQPIAQMRAIAPEHPEYVEAQPVEVTRYVEERPVEHRVTRVVEYREPEEPRPVRKERRPVNLSLNLGFSKVVNPAPQGDWCIFEERGNNLAAHAHERRRPQTTLQLASASSWWQLDL